VEEESRTFRCDRYSGTTGDEHTWHIVQALEQLFEELLRGLLVAPAVKLSERVTPPAGLQNRA
jgi:hypothetical protein